MSSAVAAPDADVAARHRLTMLSRPMRNIIECSADAKDDSCRMSPTNRFKVRGTCPTRPPQAARTRREMMIMTVTVSLSLSRALLSPDAA